MCEICEIKAKEIQRLHKVCNIKDAEIETAIERLKKLREDIDGCRLSDYYNNFEDVDNTLKNLDIIVAALKRAKD